jgi:hypothetical protein
VIDHLEQPSASAIRETSLAKVSSAAASLAAARAVLNEAIRDARAQGLPLRAIAASAGVTHQTIRAVLARFDDGSK